MLFGESSTDNYRELRYQLINGACGVVLEAEQRNLSAALFLIIVFKTGLFQNRKHREKQTGPGLVFGKNAMR